MKFKSINIAEKLNSKWAILMSRGEISIKKREILTPDASIYTIGSCFAEEIRKSLTKNSYNLYPKFSSLEFDRHNCNIDTLPDREHMNFYNLGSIYQEFQRSKNLLKFNAKDFVEVKNTRHALKDDGNIGIFRQDDSVVYHDILRRWTWSNSLDELAEVSQKISHLTLEGITRADIVIITLGMSEVFRNEKFIANEMPVHLYGSTTYKPTLLTARQNLDYLHAIVSFLKEVNKKVKIVFTVSPVGLIRTFLSNDIFTANLISKANLISALSEFLSSEPENVYYFPSYEIVNLLGWDAFEDDGRHVKPETADLIVKTFLSSFGVKS